MTHIFAIDEEDQERNEREVAAEWYNHLSSEEVQQQILIASR